MRILVVVHGFPPQAQGGSEIYAHATARELHRRFSDDVLVLTREHDTTRPEYAVRHERRDGLEIVWVNNTFRATRSFQDTYCNEAITAIAEQIVGEFQPDAAHVHHLTCLSTTIVPALARRHIPCVLTLHDYWLMCHRGQLLDLNGRVCEGPESGCHACLGAAGSAGPIGFAGAGVLRTIERQLPSVPGLRRTAEQAARFFARSSTGEAEAQNRLDHMRGICANVTEFLAPSASIRERFIAFGIPPERITHSRLGVDTSLFASLAARTSDGRLRIGFFGSLMVSKGAHILLEAIGHLPRDAVSVEVFGRYTAYHGDDSYRPVIEPLLAQDNVIERGSIAHDHVPQAMASLDVIVVPSIWPENSPMVIHEARLAGVAVVASRIGGIPELVDDGVNGLLFEPGDATQLAAALRRLLGEPDTLHRLQHSRQSVRTLADDVGSLRALYERHKSAVAADASPRSAPPGRRRLAAVVLNFRTPDDTLLATRSLLASDRTVDRVIVVDNDTSGECGRVLGDVWPRITYQASGANLGFSGGMNVGIRMALEDGADRVLLVNSDVIVPPDCIERLERALDAAAGAGIAGPLVISRARPDRVSSAGMEYNPATGRMRHRGHGDLANGTAGSADPIAGVSGCLMLVTREVWQSVGLLDEDYFFGFEDLDLCLRAARVGLRSVVAEGAVAYHEGSRAIGPDSPQRLYYASRNHLRLASRTSPDHRITSIGRSTAILALNLAHAVRTTGGSLPLRIGAVLRGASDYARGRFGPGPDWS